MNIQIYTIPDTNNAFSIAVDHRCAGTVTRSNGRGPWTFRADKHCRDFASKDGRRVYGWITNESMEAFLFGPSPDSGA